MTVTLIATIQTWEGLSGDAKPDNNIRAGSTFHELDTGRRFVYVEAAWTEDLSANLSTGRAVQLNNELRHLAEQTYMEVRAANLANGIEVA